MTAYVIMIRDKPPHDLAEMEKYAAASRGSTPDPKLTLLALYGATEALEGDKPDGVVVLEFPTVEDAKAWYDSPRYRAASIHRTKGATYRVIIVQGI